MEIFYPEAERRPPAEKHVRIRLISQELRLLVLPDTLEIECSLTKIAPKVDGWWLVKVLGSGIQLSSAASDWQERCLMILKLGMGR